MGPRRVSGCGCSGSEKGEIWAVIRNNREAAAYQKRGNACPGQQRHHLLLPVICKGRVWKAARLPGPLLPRPARIRAGTGGSHPSPGRTQIYAHVHAFLHTHTAPISSAPSLQAWTRCPPQHALSAVRLQPRRKESSRVWGRALNAQLLTLALLKHAQKKSSSGIVGSGHSAGTTWWGCPRARGEPGSAHPWAPQAVLGSGGGGRAGSEPCPRGGTRIQRLHRYAVGRERAWIAVGIP